MKKATWIKIANIAIAGIPPVIVLFRNMPVFIESTGKSLSAGAILVVLILALIFKDATKKFFQTPSAFKTCLIVFLFSLVAVNLGQQLLQISATALISGACGIPLNIWYNNETAPATTDDLLDALETYVKGDKSDEKSDSNN